MHAGLVASGAVVLIKIAPLMAQSSWALNHLFLFGVVSAILGTVYKMTQSSLKKMLTCSTMAQMGYMFMQMGLGLFSQALCHIMWHSLFKCYLFLNSGSHIQKQIKTKKALSIFEFVFCFVISGLMSFYFMKLTHISSFYEPRTLMVLFSFFTIFNLSRAMLSLNTHLKFPVCLGVSFVFTHIYGATIIKFENLFPSLITAAQFQWSPLYVIAAIAFVFLFFAMNLAAPALDRSVLFQKLYVKLLNSSQSAVKTISTNRNTLDI
jgi:NAD(P)H-quinone oxidoreductase subunit 5